MTDEVARLVVTHNVDQNLALSNSMSRSAELTSAYEGWMHSLEDAGYLDRQIEFLPTARRLETLRESGQGLARPELATLLAYTKIYLSDQVLASDLPDDPYLAIGSSSTSRGNCSRGTRPTCLGIGWRAKSSPPWRSTDSSTHRGSPRTTV